MFLTKLSPVIRRTIFKPSLLQCEASINRNSRYFATLKSKKFNSDELFPFDYDSIPSDYEEQVYKDVLNQEDAFNISEMMSIKDLFNNRCHFGHKTGLINDFMKPYLFGHRQEITIFDLNQTLEHLKKALNFTAHIAFRDGIILMVNPSKETGHIVERVAMECGEYSQCRDFDIRMFVDPEKYYKTPIRMPDLVIIFRTQTNSFETHEIVRSAAKQLIPSIAIVDSDCDPRLITYPIPANDDSPSSITLFAELFKEAILRGKEKRSELIRKEQVNRIPNIKMNEINQSFYQSTYELSENDQIADEDDVSDSFVSSTSRSEDGLNKMLQSRNENFKKNKQENDPKN